MILFILEPAFANAPVLTIQAAGRGFLGRQEALHRRPSPPHVQAPAFICHSIHQTYHLKCSLRYEIVAWEFLVVLFLFESVISEGSINHHAPNSPVCINAGTFLCAPTCVLQRLSFLRAHFLIFLALPPPFYATVLPLPPHTCPRTILYPSCIFVDGLCETNLKILILRFGVAPSQPLQYFSGFFSCLFICRDHTQYFFVCLVMGMRGGGEQRTTRHFAFF